MAIREQKALLRRRIGEDLKRLDSNEIERQCRETHQAKRLQADAESGHHHQVRAANASLPERKVNSNLLVNASRGGLDP